MEELLVYAEQPPWNAGYRAVIGFFLVPLFVRVCGEHNSPWALVLFLLCVLFALRLVPAVLRRLLPFSKEVQAVWARKRMLAKRYDSYQWAKVFWVGVGLTIHAALSAMPQGGESVLALTCFATGGFGLIFWRSRAARDKSMELLSSS